MIMDNKELGKEGERMAAEYLQGKGYRIIQRNYIKRSGEIDIISFDTDNSEYVFVEVKTRRNKSFGDPEDSVDDYKLEKITETAENWLSDNDIDDMDWRIDIISIEWDNGRYNIRHLENIS